MVRRQPEDIALHLFEWDSRFLSSLYLSRASPGPEFRPSCKQVRGPCERACFIRSRTRRRTLSPPMKPISVREARLIPLRTSRIPMVKRLLALLSGKTQPGGGHLYVWNLGPWNS